MHTLFKNPREKMVGVTLGKVTVQQGNLVSNRFHIKAVGDQWIRIILQQPNYILQ